MSELNLKKTFLYLLIGSVGLSVLVGIFVVLTGTEEQSSRVFLTSITITVASFSMFLNGVFLERLRIKVLPFIGFLTTLAAAILCIVYIWNPSDARPLAATLTLLGANFFLLPMAFYYQKKRAVAVPVLGLIGTLLVTANLINFILELAPRPGESADKFFYVAYLLAWTCFYLSLVMRASLSEKFRWSQTAAQIVAWALFVSALVLIISDGPNSPFIYETLLGRFILILIILIAAFTVLIPVFFFLGRTFPDNKPAGTVDIEREIEELKAKLAALEEKKRQMENSFVSTS
jgi:hypothetical protein